MANETITVAEAGAGTNIVVLDVGRQAAAASKSLAISTEDKAVLDAIAASLVTVIASLSIMDDWDSTDKAKVQVTTSAGAESRSMLMVDRLRQGAPPSLYPLMTF